MRNGVVHVHILYFLEESEPLLGIAQADVSEGQHEVAMDGVLLLQVAVPDEQVGQRDGEIVHRLLLENVLLAVVDELVA